jgi:alcohol dehydrogenase
MCRDAGASSIHVTDMNPKRLEQAKSFGADHTYLLGAPADSLPANIDVAFDMSGSPHAMESGLEALTIGGIAVWVGAVFNARKTQIDAESVIRRLITIKGLHNYNFDDIVEAVNYITDRHQKYPFNEIVSKEFELKDVDEAFKYALEHKPIRVGIHIH